jgi:dihydroorotate dehydrogenase (fumarate)
MYMLAADMNTTSEDIENIYVETLRSVKANIGIPVAMKISPYISAMGHFAKRLDNEGVDGLVLFNRFYQPDIDLENLEVVPNVLLSNSQSMRLPLRWIAILFGRINASLAATSGVNTAEDVLKLTMTGASVTQIFAALHKYGIDHIKTILADMEKWMTEHEYESLKMMRGSMSHRSVANPGAFERANYMKALNSFK